jgi:hypothetical protein
MNWMRLFLLGACAVLAASNVSGAAAPPASGDAANLSQLQQRRDELLKQWAAQRAEAIHANNLLAEAFDRAGKVNFNGNDAKAALLWFEAQAKSNPQFKTERDQMLSLYRLQTIVDMLGEPHGSDFVRDALASGAEPVQSVAIADEVARQLPDVKRKDLDDPPTLFDTLSKKMLANAAQLKQQATALAGKYQWPDRITQSVQAEQSAVTRRAVYNAYVEAHLPTNVHETEKELADINKRITASQPSGTSPKQ